MRLTGQTGDLADTIADRLHQRLRADSAAPLAVGFSGGGDSLALLLAADAWARRHGRDLIVLNVDHHLQQQSAAWTRACAETAAALGRPFRALDWTGPKPRHGLPAAARTARHRLLAEAAREAGARVILLGHTADDIAEAQAMRNAGSTTPSPREWSPSPVWPQGRGLFILRPLLCVRRAEIRDWLRALGRTWIEDPANANPASARARARAALDGAPPAIEAAPASLGELAEAFEATPWGGLRVGREDLRSAPRAAARMAVSMACLCAAGTSRPPRADRLERLVEQLVGSAPVVATLAGARTEADGEAVSFLREPGELGRSGVGSEPVPPGKAMIWDGRFELFVSHPGLIVRPLAGAMSGLDDVQRRVLSEFPAPARGGLPLILGDADGPACPLLKPASGVTIAPLAADRFAAACGQVQREPL